MKNTLFTVFRTLIVFVLIGKVLCWILKVGDEMNQVLNLVMFSLIGIAYIVMGFVWDNKLSRFVTIACGAFLIAMNFLKNTTTLSIVGIICILVPMFIGRFYNDNHDKISIPREHQ